MHVHFSAQLKRIPSDRGVFNGYWVFRRCRGVLRSIRGCSGWILCQKRLKLS